MAIAKKEMEKDEKDCNSLINGFEVLKEIDNDDRKAYATGAMRKSFQRTKSLRSGSTVVTLS